MRLRTKVAYMWVGVFAWLAVFLALMGRPMCIVSSLMTAFYWKVAEINLATDKELENNSKQASEPTEGE